MFARRHDPLQALEKEIGYRFRDRALLLTALTHASFVAENALAPTDNQRLEYLGDAVLGLLAAQHAYESFVEADEGALTIWRSRVASGQALTELARAIGLGAYLRIGKGEDRAGGRERATILADSMEAIFGAAWLDGGLRAGRKLFEKLVTSRCVEPAATAWTGNPKGELQERSQRDYQTAPRYTCLAVEGPAHEPLYRVRVRVGAISAEGAGKTKRTAEAEAATNLLTLLAAGNADAPAHADASDIRRAVEKR